MKIKDIEEAIDEAKKFIAEANDLLICAEGRCRGNTENTSWYSPRENGIVKARSLLLWRALAKMRRSGR